MLLGVLSDTHSDRGNAIPHIMQVFKKAGVTGIIDCGDIDSRNVDPKLYLDLPVVCALTEDQIQDPAFAEPPTGWKFTKPGDRICTVGSVKMYVGHKRSFEFLMGSKLKLAEMLNQIRRDNDRVSYMFSGHTHHQIYDQDRLISFINPGAVEGSVDGYEYAIVDTHTGKVIFSRIPKTMPIKTPFSVGVISDSLDVSELDAKFWEKLANALRLYGVKTLIHCGNIALSDIGRSELADFQVYFNLRPDQKDYKKPGSNWQLIHPDHPIVDVEGYKFYVQLDLGAILMSQSEIGMDNICMELRRKYPEITFILFGFTADAFLEEGQLVRMVNPGDVRVDRNFAVIDLPNTTITFDRIASDPLPKIS